MIWMLCLTTLALFGSLLAEPQQWAEAGVPVALSRPITEISSATNDEGYTLSVWSQSQGGVPVIVGQLLGPDGTTQWEAEGRLLAAGFERAGFPEVGAVADGWVIVWFDAEYIEWCDRLDGGWCIRSAVRAIKVNNTGTPQWLGDRAGVEIVPMMEWWDIHPYEIFPSGAGGAIVTWQQEYDGVLLARGIDAAGSVWTEPVPVTANLSGAQFVVASDELGGLVSARTRSGYADSVVHATRMFPNGEHAWGDTTGINVHTTNFPLAQIMIAADGAGGAYFGWKTHAANEEFAVQHVDAAGTNLWPEAGVIPCSLPGIQSVVAFTTSYASGNPDGVVALFHDYQANHQVRVQKISLTGTPQWGNCGVELCADMPEQSYWGTVSLASDMQGGAVFCGELANYAINPNQIEVRVSRIAANGTLPWTEACVNAGISTDYNTEIEPVSVTGNSIQTLWLEDLAYSTLYGRTLDLVTGGMSVAPIVVVTSLGATAETPQAVQLAAGATAVVWESRDNSNTSGLFFQIFNVLGAPMFGEAGQPIAVDAEGAPLASYSASLCPDGDGGFFAAFRAPQVNDIIGVRAVHVNGSGEQLGNPQGTTVLDSTDSWSVKDLFAVADGGGGCYVSASQFDETYQLRSSTVRLNPQCEPIWNEPATFRATDTDVRPAGMVAGPEQSCYLINSLYQYPSEGYNLLRMSPDGSIEWDIEIVDGLAYSQSNFFVCSDAHAGVYLVWREQLEANLSYKVMAQRVAPAGELLWGEDGLVVKDSSNVVYPNCASDGVGNLNIAWETWTTLGSDIYAQRITPAGEMLWPENGLVVSDAAADQSNPQIVALSDNEIYIAWRDSREIIEYWSNAKLYATHLNARGEIGDDSWWEEDGNAICAAGSHQSSPVMIADGAGGAMLAWSDQRTGIGYWHSSVFAQRLYDPIFTDADESPVLPTEFALQQNYPNPFNPETVIEFALPTASKTTMKVFDVTGREVATLLDQPLTAGVHRVNFNAQKLASGVYFYTLKTDQHSLTKKMVLLK